MGGGGDPPGPVLKGEGLAPPTWDTKEAPENLQLRENIVQVFRWNRSLDYFVVDLHFWKLADAIAFLQERYEETRGEMIILGYDLPDRRR